MGSTGYRRIRVGLITRLLFTITLATATVSANPVVIDSKRQPTTMTREKVVVSVGAGRSIVTGVYSFKLIPGASARRTDDHITIFVPVLLPNTNGSAQAFAARCGLPSVRIRGRKFSGKEWNDIRLDGSPAEVNVPRGWYMALYVYNIPRQYVGQAFDAEISYIQPHFPGDIVGYVPLRPPRDRDSSLVHFAAQPDRRLRDLSGTQLFSLPTESLRIIPKDRVLIRVKSLPAS